MSIGEVKAKLTLDNAQFNAGMQQSGQIANTTAQLSEKGSAKARAAFEKEQVAADRLQQKLVEVARQKQLTALKADILARSTASVADAAEKMEESFTSAGHTTVSQMQAASASIRLVEGGMTNNIRAVERFISALPGVGAILQNLFPLVGGLAFAGLLFKIGKEAYDAAQNVIYLKDAIKGLNEAQIAVDKNRQSSSDSVETSVEGILEKTQGRGAALKQKETYQRDKPIDISGYFYQDQVKKLPDDVKANYEATYKSIAPADAPQKIAAITEEVGKLQRALQTSKTDVGGISAVNVGGYGPDNIRNAVSYYETRLKLAQQIKSELEGASNERTANLQGVQVDQSDQANKDAEEKARAAKQAASEAKRAREEAYREQMASFEQALAGLRQEHQLQLGEEEEFWRSMRARTQQGSLAWLDINKRIGTAHQQTLRELAARTKEENADLARIQQGQGRGASGFEKEAARDEGVRAQDYRDSNQIAIVNARNQAHEAEARIMDQAGASITRYDAAQQIAIEHAKEFAQVSEALRANLSVAQREYGLSPTRENAKSVAEAQAAIVDAQSKRTVQVQTDNDATYGRDTSGIVGAKDALDELARSARDSAGQIHSLTSSTLDSANKTIESILTTSRREGGPHFVANQFRALGKGAASSVAGLGLTKAEGALFGAFGLGGGKKPTGAKGDPLSVVMEGLPGQPAGFGSALSFLNTGTKGDTVSDSSSVGQFLSGIGDVTSKAVGGLGGGISSVLGLLPGFASGGAIDSGTLAMVGEKGPELFMPKTSGTIIPNNKFSMGGDTHHYNIDARGAHDPAAVEAAVQRGIRQAAPGIVAGSLHAMKEQRLRAPQSSR